MNKDVELFHCTDGKCRYRITRSPGGTRHFEVSKGEGGVWRSLRLIRSPRGWLHSLAADWPPHDVVALGVVAGKLQIEFDDVLIPDEVPPFRSWREARWRATRQGNGLWQLERLWYLEDRR